MDYWVIWLVVVILLAIVELATINLVSIWFVVSGCIALIISLFTQNFYIQFASFVVLGIIFLVLTKPILNKLKKAKEDSLYLERIVGMEGLVTVEIKKDKIGEVKVDGKLWSATSDTNIPVENMIKVIRVDGIKLIVKDIEPVSETKKTPKNELPKPKKQNNKSESKKTTNKNKGKKESKGGKK